MHEDCLNCNIKLTFVCGVAKTEKDLGMDACPCKNCIVKIMCECMCERRYDYWNKLMMIENERKYNEL